MKPTFISLFSGIGGFDLGLERAGWQCVAQCDNDPFANKVLEKHWPGVKRYDDVRNVSRNTLVHRSMPYLDVVIPGYTPPIDLICGGFPCQDLSVAGKRAGLDGDRSGLWFEFHRILSELRPTFCLIENVPGLLSSDEGFDFGIVLAGLGELWPAVGWTVLDSQHFGVPQRRRRVYIIGGPSRASVQQILSLCESGDWNTQTRRAAGEDVAPTLRAGANSTGGHRPPGTDVDTSTSLVVANPLPGHHPRQDLDNDTYVTHSLRADGFDASEDGTGRGTPLTVVRTAQTGANGIGVQDDMAYTLDGTDGQAISQTMGVRRLTPVECERLQGFPDDWTKIDDKTPDGPRYKACGNAVTVPVIEYLGRRLLEVLNG